MLGNGGTGHTVGDGHPWSTGTVLTVVVVAMCLAVSTRGADVAESAVELVTEITPTDLKTLMTDEGYSVSVDKNDVVTWKLDGYRTRLFTADDGQSIQFHASFSDGNATLKKINEWNSSKRFSRTYLDDDGDPHLELDLDLTGGVAVERILEFLKTSRLSFRTWCREVVE